MADRWSKEYAPSFVTEASGGDTTAEVFQKHINELTRIYQILSRVEKFDAGTSAPADKGEHSIWNDTSTTPATLKYWTGSAWQNVFPAAWASDQDVNGHKVISSDDGDIGIEPDGTGEINLSGPVNITGETDIADKINFSGEGKGADFNKNTAYFTLQTAAAAAFDFTKGNLWKKTLSANITATFTAPPGPAWVTIIIVQNASTAYTVTWPTVAWRGEDNEYDTGNDAPDLSVKGKTYAVSLFYDGSSYLGAY